MKLLIHDLELKIDDATITEALHTIEDLLQNLDEGVYQNALDELAKILESADIDVQVAIDFCVDLMIKFGIPVPDEIPSLQEVIDSVKMTCNQ